MKEVDWYFCCWAEGSGRGTCGAGCLDRDGDRVRVQGHFQAAVQGGEDVCGLRGARILVPKREQIVDVLALEEALLLRIAQHLTPATTTLTVLSILLSPESLCHNQFISKTK